jgi:hypothetical protein
MLSVFTDVTRGRVVSIGGQAVPVVSGGGVILGGTGRVRIRTDVHESHEFWIRDREGFDHRFSMVGSTAFPPLLLNHAVTVVTAGGCICSVTNHNTGERAFYRPVPPYRAGAYDPAQNDHGLAYTVLAIISGGALLVGFAGGVTLLLSALAAVALVWLVASRALRGQDRVNEEINRHNLALDRELERLTALPLTSGNPL